MNERNLPPEAELLLTERRNLILATIRRNGSPQMSPVWFVFRDDIFVISTVTSTAKWKNLNRDPRCSVVIDGPNGSYIMATGTVELQAESRELPITREIVAKYKPSDLYQEYMDTIENDGSRGTIRFFPEKYVTSGF